MADEASLPMNPPARVLLIEDSPTVRGFLRRLLLQELPGAEIHEAEDGRAAFHLLGRQSVQLIITDINMPGMDGLTFLQKLRANPVLKRKPVLVLSSSLTKELRDVAALDPLLALMPKPATGDQLTQAFRDLLARAGRPLASAQS
jgi:two-component system chemotaxis response regulator CheY